MEAKGKSVEAYPLAWPDGYPRTKGPARSSFGKATLFKVRTDLEGELRLMGARDVIISTNMRTRADGGVYSNAREPDDSGVAVYFMYRGQSRVLACDRWWTVGENLHAIELSVAAMRGLDRWGVSEILDRIFRGFSALPAPEEWWEVLGVERTATAGQVRSAYRLKIMTVHPDAGGDGDQAARVNSAYKRAMEVVG